MFLPSFSQHNRILIVLTWYNLAENLSNLHYKNKNRILTFADVAGTIAFDVLGLGLGGYATHEYVGLEVLIEAAVAGIIVPDL